MSQYIKNLVKTSGWKEVEKIIMEEIHKSSTLETIEPDLSDEIVAREARVRSEVAKRLKALLNRINLSGQDNINKDVTYK